MYACCTQYLTKYRPERIGDESGVSSMFGHLPLGKGGEFGLTPCFIRNQHLPRVSSKQGTDMLNQLVLEGLSDTRQSLDFTPSTFTEQETELFKFF